MSLVAVKDTVDEAEAAAQADYAQRILSALSKPVAANASAEARPRDTVFWRNDAFEKAAQIAERYDCNPHCIADIRALITGTAPPHASDCDKQGETPCNYVGPCGWKEERPSDRAADVTVEEIAKFISDYTGKIEADDVARAILDTFTVGRR